MENKIVAYKAFDKDFKCLGYQYEVGGTYTHEGPVVFCKEGFHACQNPWDIFLYKNICDSKFGIVEIFGEMHHEETKSVAGKITVTAEINLPDFIKTCVDYLVEYVKIKGKKISHSAAHASTGDSATHASTGDFATHASTGDFAKHASTGDSAAHASTGDSATHASTGDFAKHASTGDSATHASTGDFAKHASTGYSATHASTGDFAKHASTGDSATHDSEGSNAVIVCAGSVEKFRVGIGGCIAAAYYDGERTRFSTLYEGEGIKAGVWYKLDADGTPVEMETSPC